MATPTTTTTPTSGGTTTTPTSSPAPAPVGTTGGPALKATPLVPGPAVVIELYNDLQGMGEVHLDGIKATTLKERDLTTQPVDTELLKLNPTINTKDHLGIRMSHKATNAADLIPVDINVMNTNSFSTALQSAMPVSNIALTIGTIAKVIKEGFLVKKSGTKNYGTLDNTGAVVWKAKDEKFTPGIL